MAQSVVIAAARKREGTRLRLLRDHWTLAIGAAILVVIAVAAVLAPFVAPHGKSVV